MESSSEPRTRRSARLLRKHRATDELIDTIDLDARHPLPEAPWFEAGASWSARRPFVHIAAETAQHAGHADILREPIDDQRWMGSPDSETGCVLR